MAAAAAPAKRASKEDILKLGMAAKDATGKDFQGVDAPTGATPGSLKVVDKDLKNRLIRVGAAVVVQSPAPGNPSSNALSRRPFIVQLYPKFDAPAPQARPRASGGRRTPQSFGVARGILQIPKASLPFDHARVRAYLDACSPTNQRSFEERKQNGLTDVEVTKAIKGLRGELLLAKLRELEDSQNRDFRSHLAVLGFPSEMIEILGIPEVGPDSPDKK